MTDNINDVINILGKMYPEAETALNYNTPFELLIATILSAQSTDKQVNKVTEKLFNKYNSSEDFARLNPEELGHEIRSIGLYHNKSKYIIASSKMLLEEFAGQVPDTRKELMQLPGVGRKTANVVLACAFKQNSFPVDTHVRRVANRIGLADSDNVLEIEKQLMNKIPEELWAQMHHRLINHGRALCKARNPECYQCQLNCYCHYYNKKENQV